MASGKHAVAGATTCSIKQATHETDVLGGRYRGTVPAKRDRLHDRIHSVEAQPASITRAWRGVTWKPDLLSKTKGTGAGLLQTLRKGKGSLNRSQILQASTL